MEMETKSDKTGGNLSDAFVFLFNPLKVAMERQ